MYTANSNWQKYIIKLISSFRMTVILAVTISGQAAMYKGLEDSFAMLPVV